MMSSTDCLFSEFFNFCASNLVGENPKILDLIQHRYDDCQGEYRSSQDMADLLTETKRKMEVDKSRLFVHLKEFTDILKAKRKSKKKSAIEKKRKRQPPHEPDSETKECSSICVKQVSECNVSHPLSSEKGDSICESSEAKRRKIHSCSLGDGHIKEAEIIRVSKEGEKLKIGISIAQRTTANIDFSKNTESSFQNSSYSKRHSLLNLTNDAAFSCTKKVDCHSSSDIGLDVTEIESSSSSKALSSSFISKDVNSALISTTSSLTKDVPSESEHAFHCTASPKHKRSVSVVTVNDSDAIICTSDSPVKATANSVALSKEKLYFSKKDVDLENRKPKEGSLENVKPISVTSDTSLSPHGNAPNRDGHSEGEAQSKTEHMDSFKSVKKIDRTIHENCEKVNDLKEDKGMRANSSLENENLFPDASKTSEDMPVPVETVFQIPEESSSTVQDKRDSDEEEDCSLSFDKAICNTKVTLQQSEINEHFRCRGNNSELLGENAVEKQCSDAISEVEINRNNSDPFHPSGSASCPQSKSANVGCETKNSEIVVSLSEKDKGDIKDKTTEHDNLDNSGSFVESLTLNSHHSTLKRLSLNRISKDLSSSNESKVHKTTKGGSNNGSDDMERANNDIEEHCFSSNTTLNTKETHCSQGDLKGRESCDVRTSNLMNGPCDISLPSDDEVVDGDVEKVHELDKDQISPNTDVVHSPSNVDSVKIISKISDQDEILAEVSEHSVPIIKEMNSNPNGDKDLMEGQSRTEIDDESLTAKNDAGTSPVKNAGLGEKAKRRVPLASVDDQGASKMSFLGNFSLAAKDTCGSGDGDSLQAKAKTTSSSTLSSLHTGKKDKEMATTSSSIRNTNDIQSDSADEFTSAQTENFRRVVEAAHAKGKKPPSERHIKKLENLLEKLRDEIERGQELTLDEMDQEDSFYIYEDKLKKKFVAAWNKLCELTDRKVTTGRPTERTIRYEGTRYREINRRLEKFLNKRKQFPDFQDVKTIIQLTNKKCNLHLSTPLINDVAREAFVDIGDMLQTRRHQDFIATFGSRQTDNFSSYCDPAINDPELRRKLEQNSKVGRSNLEAVINKYTELQYTRGTVEEDSDDDEDDDEDDNDESERNINSKHSKKVKTKRDRRSEKERRKEGKKRRRKISSSSSGEESKQEEEEELRDASLGNVEDIASRNERMIDMDEENGTDHSSSPIDKPWTALPSTPNAATGCISRAGKGPNIKYTKRKPLTPPSIAAEFDDDSYSNSPVSADLDSEITIVAPRVMRNNFSIISNPESEDETSESDEEKDIDQGASKSKEDNDDEDSDILIVSSDANSEDDEDDDVSSKCPSPVSVISLGSLSEDEDDYGHCKQVLHEEEKPVEQNKNVSTDDKNSNESDLSSSSPSISSSTKVTVKKSPCVSDHGRDPDSSENLIGSGDDASEVDKEILQQSTPSKKKMIPLFEDDIIILDTPEKESSCDVAEVEKFMSYKVNEVESCATDDVTGHSRRKLEVDENRIEEDREMSSNHSDGEILHIPSEGVDNGDVMCVIMDVRTTQEHDTEEFSGNGDSCHENLSRASEHEECENSFSLDEGKRKSNFEGDGKETVKDRRREKGVDVHCVVDVDASGEEMKKSRNLGGRTREVDVGNGKMGDDGNMKCIGDMYSGERIIVEDDVIMLDTEEPIVKSAAEKVISSDDKREVQENIVKHSDIVVCLSDDIDDKVGFESGDNVGKTTHIEIGEKSSLQNFEKIDIDNVSDGYSCEVDVNKNCDTGNDGEGSNEKDEVRELKGPNGISEKSSENICEGDDGMNKECSVNKSKGNDGVSEECSENKSKGDDGVSEECSENKSKGDDRVSEECSENKSKGDDGVGVSEECSENKSKGDDGNKVSGRREEKDGGDDSDVCESNLSKKTNEKSGDKNDWKKEKNATVIDNESDEGGEFTQTDNKIWRIVVGEERESSMEGENDDGEEILIEIRNEYDNDENCVGVGSESKQDKRFQPQKDKLVGGDVSLRSVEKEHGKSEEMEKCNGEILISGTEQESAGVESKNKVTEKSGKHALEKEVFDSKSDNTTAMGSGTSEREVIDLSSDSESAKDTGKFVKEQDKTNMDSDNEYAEDSGKRAKEQEMINVESDYKNAKDTGECVKESEVIDLELDDKNAKDSGICKKKEDMIDLESDNTNAKDSGKYGKEQEMIQSENTSEHYKEEGVVFAKEETHNLLSEIGMGVGVAKTSESVRDKGRNCVENSEEWKVGSSQDFEVYMDSVDDDDDDDVFNSIAKLCNSIIHDSGNDEGGEVGGLNDKIQGDLGKTELEKKEKDSDLFDSVHNSSSSSSSSTSGKEGDENEIIWPLERHGLEIKSVRIFVTDEGELIERSAEMQDDLKKKVVKSEVMDDYTQEALKVRDFFEENKKNQKMVVSSQKANVVRCIRSKEDDRKLVDELMDDAFRVSNKKKRKVEKCEFSSVEDVCNVFNKRLKKEEDSDTDLEIINVNFVPKSMKLATLKITRMSEFDIIVEKKKIKLERELQEIDSVQQVSPSPQNVSDDDDEDDLPVSFASQHSDPVDPSSLTDSTKSQKNISSSFHHTNSRMLCLGPRPNVMLSSSPSSVSQSKLSIQKLHTNQHNSGGFTGVTGQRRNPAQPPPSSSSQSSKMKGVNWGLIYASLPPVRNQNSPQVINPTSTNSSSPSAGSPQVKNLRSNPGQPIPKKPISAVPKLHPRPQHYGGSGSGSIGSSNSTSLTNFTPSTRARRQQMSSSTSMSSLSAQQRGGRIFTSTRQNYQLQRRPTEQIQSPSAKHRPHRDGRILTSTRQNYQLQRRPVEQLQSPSAKHRLNHHGMPAKHFSPYQPSNQKRPGSGSYVSHSQSTSLPSSTNHRSRNSRNINSNYNTTVSNNASSSAAMSSRGTPIVSLGPRVPIPQMPINQSHSKIISSRRHHQAFSQPTSHHGQASPSSHATNFIRHNTSTTTNNRNRTNSSNLNPTGPPGLGKRHPVQQVMGLAQNSKQGQQQQHHHHSQQQRHQQYHSQEQHHHHLRPSVHQLAQQKNAFVAVQQKKMDGLVMVLDDSDDEEQNNKKHNDDNLSNSPSNRITATTTTTTKSQSPSSTTTPSTSPRSGSSPRQQPASSPTKGNGSHSNSPRPGSSSTSPVKNSPGGHGTMASHSTPRHQQIGADAKNSSTKKAGSGIIVLSDSE